MAFVDMALQFNPQGLADDTRSAPANSGRLPTVYLGNFRHQLRRCALELGIFACLNPSIELPDDPDLHITSIPQESLDYLQQIDSKYKYSANH
jgi:hypothetical protein